MAPIQAQKNYIVGNPDSLNPAKRKTVEFLPEFATLYRARENAGPGRGLLATPFTIIATPAWAAEGNSRVWTANHIVALLREAARQGKEIYFEDEAALRDYGRMVTGHRKEILIAIGGEKQLGEFPLLQAIFETPAEFAEQTPKTGN